MCGGLGSCLDRRSDVCHEDGVEGPNRLPLHGWCGKQECLPVKCPNYLLCGREDPAVLLDARGHRCFSCSMQFGRDLKFSTPLPGNECPVCFGEGLQLKLPGCTHALCIACYKLTERPFRCPLCRAEHPPPFVLAGAVRTRLSW
jgi:hypothetical protein